MPETLLAEVKSDRIDSRVLIDISALEPVASGSAHRVVRLGSPDVQENRMCAQCVGECKVF